MSVKQKTGGKSVSSGKICEAGLPPESGWGKSKKWEERAILGL
jgi:hypothetical protein